MAGPFLMPPPVQNLKKPASALSAVEEDPNLAMLSPVARDALKAKKKQAAPVTPPVQSVLS